MQQPSIGRIVHFHQQEVVGTITSHRPVTRTYAAIVTEVLPRDHGEGDVADDECPHCVQDLQQRAEQRGDDGPPMQPRITRAMRLGLEAMPDREPLPSTPRVSLRVFFPDRDQNVTGVPFNEEARPEHWSWPPRT